MSEQLTAIKKKSRDLCHSDPTPSFHRIPVSKKHKLEWRRKKTVTDYASWKKIAGVLWSWWTQGEECTVEKQLAVILQRHLPEVLSDITFSGFTNDWVVWQGNSPQGLEPGQHVNSYGWCFPTWGYDICCLYVGTYNINLLILRCLQIFWVFRLTKVSVTHKIGGKILQITYVFSRAFV